MLDSGLQVFHICIRKTGIFKPADIETQLINHNLEACQPEMQVRVHGADMVVALVEEEIGY